MTFLGSSGRPWVPASDVTPPSGEAGEKMDCVRSPPVGVAVPELLGERDRFEVDAKTVERDWLERR
jgi:hypothetical protein